MTAEERALVERLRAVGGSFDPAWHNAGTVNQAASLIERIAAERDTAEARAEKAEAERYGWQNDAEDSRLCRDEAEARVKELEEALRGLLAIAERNEAGEAVDRARAALTPAPSPDRQP